MKNHSVSDSFPLSGFAGRMDSIPRSCIRELLSGGRPSLISFGGGVPHDSCVPVDAIRTAFDTVMTRYGAQAFRYGASEGETGLQEFIALEWLPRFGLSPDPSDILIVNGSQQALDLLGKVLVDPGAPVLVERPTYIAALQAFSAFEPRFFDMPLERDGVENNVLESALKRHQPRLFYTIPSFQNPSCACYSGENRLGCAEALNRHADCVLVEDDPYSELYYDCKPPKPMCTAMVRNAVLLGTFSKTVAPGFRLGWIWAQGELRRHLITAKQAADLCTGRFQQLLLLETLRHLDMDAHLQRNRVFYRQQRERMHCAMSRHLAGYAAWNPPAGGMFFWVHLCRDLHARTLLTACVERGVAFAEGSSFHAGGGGLSTMRLNFTQSSPDEMEKGLALIAGVIRELEARG
jgi:2-aminoadipate transaminase